MANAEKDTGKIAFTVHQLLANTYGPYAFGLITFVTVWFISIAPQLESMRIDYQAQQVLVNELRQLNSGHDDVARTMERTAGVLERTVMRLEEWEKSK